MATFSLSISSQYVPSWGPYEACREILQNACDSQQDGHSMHINHDPSIGILTIANSGVRLDRSVWLLGMSSKAAGGYRGKYGEGFALGILALVRAGRTCRIVNDDEDWTPSLQNSKAFPGQQLLTIATRKRRSPSKAFSVHMECSTDEWAEYSQSFLDLKPSISRIQTGDTDILNDNHERGRCYVKGILVETKSDLAAGYNFSAACTDRDRRMINSFDFNYYCANAWANATRDGLLTTEQFLDFLEGGSSDTKGLGESSMPNDVVHSVAIAYSKRHGEQAIPVASYAEVNDAGHLGRVGLITNIALCGFFSDHPNLSLAKVRNQHRCDVSSTYRINDLTPQEKYILQLGLQLVESVSLPMGFDPINHRLEIVDFLSTEISGVHCRDDDRGTTTIRIARRALCSLEEFLRVLVHELAHDHGGDGDVRHERAEGRIFSRIVATTIDIRSHTALPSSPELTGATA